jgi:hypothetical protein
MIQSLKFIERKKHSINSTGVVEKVAYKIFCGEQGRRPEYQFNYQVGAKPGTLCEHRCPDLDQ